MTTALRTALAAAILTLAGVASPTVAQEAKPGAAKPQAAPKPAQAPKTANTAKPAAKPAGQQARARNVPPPTTAEQMASLPPADEAQRAASELVHYGKYVCDEKWEVFIERNQIFEHYVDVRYKKDVWVMKPVASSTGAIRLEDIRGRVLLVQIPFKSMLLNTQTGQRIIDACQHDAQREAESQSRTEAQPAATTASK